MSANQRTDEVDCREDGAALWITIMREPQRNALNESVMRCIEAALSSVPQRSAVRAVVVTGAGDRAFCAGGDLKAKSSTFGIDVSQPTTPYADMLRAAAACSVPLVARVNGACMAGGMGLLAMCDMAVASDDAQFGLPEVKVGMFPMQVAALLQDVVPTRRLAEMCFTGEPLSAIEALGFGLLNYVVPRAELDEKIAFLLARLVDKSPSAIRRGRYALRHMASMQRDQALAYAEAQIASLVMTDDAQEGMRSFAEKRAPQWTVPPEGNRS